MNMKKYMEPVMIRIIRFPNHDIITTSGTSEDEGEDSKRDQVGFGDPTTMPD